MRHRFVLLAPTIAASMALASCASTPSTSMGESSSAIKACSFAPHCVSSINPVDSARGVEPFAYTGSREAAHGALIEVLRSHENARVDINALPLISATFRTTIGFADEVTFLFRDDASTIDVKSRSRIGYYDFGVNRRRVEALRVEFAAALAKVGTTTS